MDAKIANMLRRKIMETTKRFALGVLAVMVILVPLSSHAEKRQWPLHSGRDGFIH